MISPAFAWNMSWGTKLIIKDYLILKTIANFCTKNRKNTNSSTNLSDKDVQFETKFRKTLYYVSSWSYFCNLNYAFFLCTKPYPFLVAKISSISLDTITSQCSNSCRKDVSCNIVQLGNLLFEYPVFEISCEMEI